MMNRFACSRLTQNEQFASGLKAGSIQALRAKPAEELLKATLKPDAIHFEADRDGIFLPEGLGAIYAAGKQSLIPLLKLRFAQPALVLDIGRLPSMSGVTACQADQDWLE